MSGLSPEARRIIDEARGGEEPTGGDRDRIRSSLIVKLGAGLAAGTAATSAASGAAAAGAKAAGTGLLAGLLPKGILVLSAAGAIGIGAYSMQKPESAPFAPPAVVASASAMTVPAQPIAQPVEAQPSDETAEPEPEVVQKAPATTVNTAPSPRLAEEVESLKEAHTALREGRADEAIEVLDRDASAGDAAGLEQEREAMRVFALCKLGKQEEARRAAEVFLSRWPRSPLASRVAASCRP